MYFTRNGSLVSRVGSVPAGRLFPHVALLSPGEKVQFNFGAVSPVASAGAGDTPPRTGDTLEGHGAVRVDAAALTATYADTAPGGSVSSARWTVPLSPELPYFEVTVLNGGARNDVGVGVSTGSYSMAKFPGTP